MHQTPSLRHFAPDVSSGLHNSHRVPDTQYPASSTQVEGIGPISSTGKNPSRSAQPRTINVVLFSDPPARKNLVIDLITGTKVSPDGNRRTMQFTRYDITLDGIDFTMFDTIGLANPWMKPNDYLNAVENAYKLIQELTAAGGIHILLFCVLGGRITATTQSNYRVFYECLCGTRVPIILAFTGLSERAKIEDWRTRNETHLQHFGIRIDGHVCLSTGQNDLFAHDLAESQKEVLELLRIHALKDRAFSPEPYSWLASFGKASHSFVWKQTIASAGDVIRVLTDRCQVDREVAERVAIMMNQGQARHTSSSADITDDRRDDGPGDERSVVHGGNQSQDLGEQVESEGETRADYSEARDRFSCQGTPPSSVGDEDEGDLANITRQFWLKISPGLPRELLL